MILLAEGGILSKFVCDSTDCLSYIISLLDILTVLYLSYCASFRVNKGVRIFGWVWAAVVVAATVAIIAIHTCLFTLVSALFTALVLMALFGVTFESITNERKNKESKDARSEKPAPFVCPYAQPVCPMMQRPVAAAETAPVATETAAAEVAADTETIDESAPVEAAPASEPASAAPQEGLSLRENIEIARATVSHSKIDKAYIAMYLADKYGDRVLINRRGNETKTGLPLADTHYAVGDKKVCFVYVYEIGTTTMLLLNVNDEYGQSLAKKHPIVKKSAFPKSKDAWYSLIVDDSFMEGEVEAILDDAFKMNGGKVAEEGLALREILATANATATSVDRSKKGIADFLKGEFGDAVRVNCRGNYTKTGLPLADTHYAIGENGSKCFVYVYETDAAVVLLICLTDKYAESVRSGGHRIMRSAFPKSKDSWYSIILDDTYTEADIQEILIDAYNMAK